MALTKAEIAEQLYEELGLNKREAKEFVEIFFGEISDILVEGTDVKISGFGNFILRDKKKQDQEEILKLARMSKLAPEELLHLGQVKN